MGDKNKITIIFIINGVDVSVEENVHEPLHVARDHALQKSGDTGRPFNDWVIRDDKGVTLPPDQKIERFNFPEGVRLFLMPAIGAGG